MKSTGETVSETVRNLLAIAVSEDRDSLAQHTVNIAYRKKLAELADYLDVSHTYMPRKLKAGVWTTKDLDRLADFFHMWPVEFVPGPHDEPEQEKP